jgi:uncharacterized protein YndB with AHSA1/START domain
MTISDRIEKEIFLRAPIDRVFSALSKSEEFGVWFGVTFDGPFVAGQKITGKMRPTQVDPEVAKLQKPFEGQAFDCTIERIEPPRLFSFRWHPYAIDPKADYSSEPFTLVVFELTEVDGGTRLKITESGFDKIPLERRAEAFTSNEGGWEHQSQLIKKYVEKYAA